MCVCVREREREWVAALQVACALKTAGEHKKALEQAQRMEQEFMSLVTGQRSVEGDSCMSHSGSEETEREDATVSFTVICCVCVHML